jgi:signal peptidase II
VDRAARRSAAIVFGTAGGAYVLDRVSKIWAEHTLVNGPVDVVSGLFTLRFTTNPGGAFSFGTSAPWFFAAATVVVSSAIVATAFRNRRLVHAFALGLVLGGAVGNLTDRLIRGPGLSGNVVDFIDLHYWPVFNLADTAIVVGALLLAATSLHPPGSRGRRGGARDGAPRRAGDAG